jgi:gamma-glutamyltranspeptidase/glutathione hydrolase
MVASQARGAAEAGVAILEAGGTAADAAVATAFALATLEPWNSGLGGIGFAQVMAPGGAAETFDFGPVSPRGLKPSAFPMTGKMKADLFTWPEVLEDRNVHGPLSFAIPSAVAGYMELHARHGRMPIKDVLAPAVALAQGAPGFFPQGNLAATLERLAHAGLADFYTGDIAAAIAADCKDMGAFVSVEDLANCKARVLPALEAEWRGKRLMLANGLTAAPTLLRVLEGMKGADFSGKAPSTAWYAQLARVLRAAYAERLAGLGDAEPKAAESCTTHLTVADKNGMMVAMTTTLLSSMGSRVVLPKSGVLMNNGVMWFDPRPEAANALAPGKRPLTNMCPVIAAEGDKPVIATGASGGRRIMASVFQMLSFVADFGMGPEAAAHHPRLDVSGPEGVTADIRLGAETLAALAAKDTVTEVEHAVLPVNFACPNLIQIGADGLRTGITDAMSPWSAAIAEA